MVSKSTSVLVISGDPPSSVMPRRAAYRDQETWAPCEGPFEARTSSDSRRSRRSHEVGQGGVVDVRGEQPGRRDRRTVTEPAAVQVRAGDELAHVTPGREGPQRGHQRAPALLVALVDGGARGGVEHVAEHPLVTVGDPARPGRRFAEPPYGGRLVALMSLEQAEPPGGHALPARVVELAAQHPRLFEPVGGPVHVAGDQVELGLEGLRPRQQRHPALLADQLQRARDRDRRLAVLGAQEVRAADHRQGPRLLPPVVAALGPFEALAQELEGARIVATVGGVLPTYG